jgi:hypothetical protein
VTAANGKDFLFPRHRLFVIGLIVLIVSEAP